MVHVEVEIPNCIVGTRENKNLSPFVSRCESERLEITGIGDYWWRC
ncbi:MAG: hypothetical protein RLZZ264_383 [Bacillota bacterium]|jgi:hypothetical protein